VPASSHSPRWIDSGKAVVTMPGEIDVVNSGEVSERLAEVIGAGARTVIADMSGTEFCDSAGVKAVVHAYRHAKAQGCELRLVVTAAAVRRVFGLTEVDRLIPICETMDEALSTLSDPAS
jgi:anti-sigma B factor antagonist